MDTHEQIRRRHLTYDAIIATYVAVRYEKAQPARAGSNHDNAQIFIGNG